MSNERFSVFQWLEDGSYECVRSHVSDVEAVKAFAHYTTSVAAKMGITTRVIITDAGDLICAEWLLNEGIIYPPMPPGSDGKIFH